MSFTLLKFPMPKSDWSEENISTIHGLLKDRISVRTIARNFPNATMGDVCEIARLLGIKPRMGYSYTQGERDISIKGDQ